MTAQQRRRIVGAAVAGLAFAGLLAGCASRPGAAAVVDGRQVRTSDVAVALDELAPIYQGVTPQLVLQDVLTEPVVADLAVEAGLAVSDDEALALLANAYGAVQQEPPAEYSPATITVARFQVALNKFQAEGVLDQVGQQYVERVAELDVTVNPRFGDFDAGAVTEPAVPAWVVGASSS